MTETEVKLKYKNKKKIVLLLKEAGFFLKKNIIIKDQYFGNNGRSMTNKQQLIRIRNIEGEHAELTLKDSLKNEKGIWSRREINVPIVCIEKAVEFIVALGYQEIKKNCSKREIWEKNKVVVEFISYSEPAKLEFIEIESDNIKVLDNLINYLGKEVSIAGEELFSIFDNACITKTS